LKLPKTLRGILNYSALWIKHRITLARIWLLYAIALIVFVILSLVYPDTFRLTLGISILTIVMMYLIMVSSNIELRKATETQIKTLVSQLQTLESELKNVSEGIKALTNVMLDVRTTLLESTMVSKTAIARAEEEKRRRKESIKPRLSVMVEQTGRDWLVTDTRHYHVILWNSGCDAIGTIILIRGLEYGPYDIATRGHADIDIGHINTFIGITSLSVSLLVRDVDRNPYQSDFQVSLPQSNWSLILLNES
jgi:hypothetical protein